MEGSASFLFPPPMRRPEMQCDTDRRNDHPSAVVGLPADHPPGEMEDAQLAEEVEPPGPAMKAGEEAGMRRLERFLRREPILVVLEDDAGPDVRRQLLPTVRAGREQPLGGHCEVQRGRALVLSAPDLPVTRRKGERDGHARLRAE